MMFSTKAEYGVRVMVELARRAASYPGETGAVVPLAEIAEHDNLPLAYLEHVVARLRKAGLVSSRRGSRGGYLLTRAPHEITMAEVVLALEGSIAPIECISEQSDGSIVCSRESEPGHICPTKLLWTRVHASIVSTLRDTTLADLLAGTVTADSSNLLTPTPLLTHGAPTPAAVTDVLRNRALTPIEPMTTGA